LLGTFYANRSSRKKDDGYALYYMLFNIGAALGGLLCGYLGQNINWHIGFGAACLFMIIGQLQFILGIKKHQGLPPDRDRLKEKVFLNLLDREAAIYILSLAVVGTVVAILQHPGAMNMIMLPIAALSFIYIFIISFRFTRQERWKLFAAMTLLLMTSLFWACYEQCSGSLSLFVLHNVNLNLAGFHLSGLSINSFTPAAWLVVLTPISIKVWDWLHRRNTNPRTYTKFLIAFFFLAFCFLVLWTGCYLNRHTGLMPVILLIAAYAFLEVGEICIGPVAYSLASNLSPKAIVSTLMGVMYLSVSLGEFLSGKLGSLMAVPSTISDPVQMMPYFSSVFLKIAAGAVLIAVLIMALIPVLKKWMQEVW
ncbi:MAG: oligopeptide:H+ symporter, partial [Bacteroidota bacterium]|nr:oligopeptide:H+ symporter [Bacteroidota bacterium]